MPNEFWNRPCASKGWISYRYPSAHSWIMIGAKDHDEALREAQRSMWIGTATMDRLEIWSEPEQAYVPVTGL